jgi:hypothetical protein
VGIAVACVSLLISVLSHTLRKDQRPTWVPSIAFPLLVLFAVVFVTAQLTGGIGAKALGSSNYGGKRYLMLFGAIVGYFAFTARTIPKERAQLMGSLFFLSGLSGAGSDLIYAAGPSAYFLYAVFPANLASMQALSQQGLLRLSGLAWGAIAFCYFLLMRYGLRGLLDFTRPWRLAIFLGAIGAGALGGFRSLLVIIGFLVISLIWLERLYKTPLFIALLMLVIVGGGFTITFIDRMPLAVQRSLSFLPLDIDPMAKQDAMSTLDWRFQIWKIVFPEVPKYLWLGKGFGFSAADLYLTEQAITRGFYQAYEDMLITGSYHNGLLTTIIPFGLAGLAALLWFVIAALRALYANYRHGAPELTNINTFLLAFFVTRLLFFLTLYGQFDLDLMVFTGVIGMSISINGGVARPRVVEQASEPVPEREALAPALLELRPQGHRA